MMNNTSSKPPINDQWKQRNYIAGFVIGSALGLVTAYMFNREAEANAENNERPQIPPTTLIGVLISMISLIRKIAETGKKRE